MSYGVWTTNSEVRGVSRLPRATSSPFLIKPERSSALLPAGHTWSYGISLGLVADYLLEQIAGPGRCNAVTMVQWQSADAMEAAKPAVIDAHAAVSFAPVACFDSVGIELRSR